MNATAKRIAENLAAIRDQISQAAARSGRSADAVRLVAVTKYVGPDLIRPLVEAGCAELGESRPQALWDKAAALDDLTVRWHLVGHLQRNKVRRTLPLVSLIHSADSPRLVEAIEAEAAGMSRPARVLLEINVSGDAAKHGARPEDAESLLVLAAKQRHIEVRGLMAMARLEGDAATARADFARLRELRDRLARGRPSNTQLTELSMGMSGDFVEAIEEGATIVRIGSALFQGLKPR
jgi:pyridoxal phosphate enzyme (YggS family)